MDRKLILYIIAIIVILVLVFFGEQAYSGIVGKKVSGAFSGAAAYMAKGSNWVNNNVQGRGEAMKNELNQAKISTGNVLEKIGDYFSGIKNSILNKEENNCPPATTPSTQTSSN